MRGTLACFISLLTLAVTGCTSYQVPSYQSEPQNIRVLQGTAAQYRVKMVSTTDNDNGAIVCRGAGPVTVGEQQTYANYIVTGLHHDLIKADAFSEGAPLSIEATFTKIDFQSDLGASNWYISATYKLGAEMVNIDTIYNDRSSFAGNVACQNMSLYFPKAVAAHLSQLYNSVLFKSKLQAQPPTLLPPSLTTKLLELRQAFEAGLLSESEYEAKRKSILDGI